MATQREISRTDWTGNPRIEDINSGSLQRIADACELMAKNHNQLQEERDRYKRWYELEVVRVRRRDHQVAALKGVITKMKKRSAVANG